MARNILVVDDEETFRYSARIALMQAGYRVAEAEDGEKALRLILAVQALNPFDIIVLDIQMPKMTGFELAKELSARSLTIPIIFVSGYGGDYEDDDGTTAGRTDILHKPFEPWDLLKRIEKEMKSYNCEGS